jgi:hypothetical protein
MNRACTATCNLVERGWCLRAVLKQLAVPRVPTPSTHPLQKKQYPIQSRKYNLKMVVELPYSLHSRYASIAIAWTVIIIPPTFINVGLFYGLWYGKPEMNRLLGTIFHFQISCG